MFCGSVLVSLWLVFLMDFGHLSEVYLVLIAGGALPMAVFGWLLDRLPVSRRLCVSFYIVAAIVLFAWGLLSFPTLKAAISKNGSISAYAYCAANLSMYLTVMLYLASGTILWLWRRVRKTRMRSSSGGCIATIISPARRQLKLPGERGNAVAVFGVVEEGRVRRRQLEFPANDN